MSPAGATLWRENVSPWLLNIRLEAADTRRDTTF
jgi:hypothetical protein